MYVFSLSIRNISRHWKKSLSTFLTISISMASLIIFTGYITSIKYSLETAFVRSIGHLQLQHADFLVYGQGDPVKFSVNNADELLSLFRNDPELNKLSNSISGHLSTGGIASYEISGATRNVWINGFEYDEKRVMYQWNPYNIRFANQITIPDNLSPDDIFIGTGLALVLRMCDLLPNDYPVACTEAKTDEDSTNDSSLSDLDEDIQFLAAQENSSIPSQKNQLDLLVSTLKGLPNITRGIVVGVEKQSSREVDDIFVGMNLPILQSLIYNNESKVTSIVFQFHETEMIPAASKRIIDLLAKRYPEGHNLVINNFQKIQPLFDQIINMFNGIFNFILIIILILIIFTISNTINMSVLDRVNEIGTMRSLGMTKNGIKAVFIVEGTLLGLIGSSFGIIISIALSFAINSADLIWYPPGVVSGQLISIDLLSDLKTILLSILLVNIISLLASILPANKAANMTIIDALRHL